MIWLPVLDSVSSVSNVQRWLPWLVAMGRDCDVLLFSMLPLPLKVRVNPPLVLCSIVPRLRLSMTLFTQFWVTSCVVARQYANCVVLSLL